MEAIRSPLSCFLTALRFLTIFPITWKAEKDGAFFQGSLYYFAPIGLIIGLATAGIIFAVSSLFPPLVMAGLVIVLLGVFSGFLHLDGLADTSDGFFSSRPREKILVIMRDSRIGAMGVVAILLVILLKFSALASLNPSTMLATIILMPIGGRAAIVFSMAILPYARKEQGLGAIFYSDDCVPAALWALGVLAFCTFFIEIKAVLLISGVVISVVLLFSFWCKKMIGGATGDTLGALCEITEMSICVAMTCLYSMQ